MTKTFFIKALCMVRCRSWTKTLFEQIFFTDIHCDCTVFLSNKNLFWHNSLDTTSLLSRYDCIIFSTQSHSSSWHYHEIKNLLIYVYGHIFYLSLSTSSIQTMLLSNNYSQIIASRIKDYKRIICVCLLCILVLYL